MDETLVDNQRPWPATGLTTQGWIDTVPVVRVDTRELVFTQDVNLLYMVRALQGHTNYTHDAYPHVILWRGVKYIEDGHHRLAGLIVSGNQYALVRLLNMDERLDTVQKS